MEAGELVSQRCTLLALSMEAMGWRPTLETRKGDGKLFFRASRGTHPRSDFNPVRLIVDL